MKLVGSARMWCAIFVGWACLIGGCGGTGGTNGGNDNGPMDGGSENGNDNSGGVKDGGNDVLVSLVPVVTEVVVDSAGDIAVGDDVIAIGTGGNEGVQYLVPSTGETTARTISNFNHFAEAGFAVCGEWIVVRDDDGKVTALNAHTDELRSFPSAVIAVSTGSAPLGTHEFWCDGNLMVTVTDTGTVNDGALFKMIDFGDSPPTVTSFQNPPEQAPSSRNNETIHLAIDAEAMQFVAQIVDQFVLYDISNPGGDPQVFDVSGEGGTTNAVEIQLDGGFVIYHDHDGASGGRHVTRLLDTATGTVTLLDENPSAARPVALQNGSFGYFVDITDADTGTNATVRSVFGEIGAMGPSYTLISGTDDAIGSDPSDGLLGYGCTVAITPDARLRFIAGCGTVAVAEYLQVSAGRSILVVPDPSGDDPLGMPASEVHASNSLCAFRTTGDLIAYVTLD